MDRNKQGCDFAEGIRQCGGNSCAASDLGCREALRNISSIVDTPTTYFLQSEHQFRQGETFRISKWRFGERVETK